MTKPLSPNAKKINKYIGDQPEGELLASTSEISKATGLSMEEVNEAMDELLAAGVIGHIGKVH